LAASLLAMPDGAELLAVVLPGRLQQRIAVRELRADGSLAPWLDRRAPFGGGRTASIEVEQTYFDAAPAFAAPGGRVVVPGAVVVAQPAGEEDSEQRNAAVAVFSRTLALDASFGAPLRRATLRIAIPRQDITLPRIGKRQLPPALKVRVRTASPGLAAVELRFDGHLVARRTAAVWKAGWSSVDVLLTRTGARRLRRERSVELRATARSRDLLGATATATSRRATVQIRRR
jgi:hypothetical protein